jgi:hypothetical protein
VAAVRRSGDRHPHPNPPPSRGRECWGVGTIRYPRLVPKDAASAARLKKRTLTNLYNERSAWLAAAHRRLDEAVAAAYGWPADLPDDDLLARLLALNLSRAATGEPAEGE